MQEMQETQVRFLGRDDWSLWVGNGNPLQYFCPKNPMDRGALQAAVHGVAKSQTRLSDFTFTSLSVFKGFPGGSDGKESACKSRRLGFNPWVEKIPWRRAWQPTPVFFRGESHGQRSLVGYSPWGRKELNTVSDSICLQETFQNLLLTA